MRKVNLLCYRVKGGRVFHYIGFNSDDDTQLNEWMEFLMRQKTPDITLQRGVEMSAPYVFSRKAIKAYGVWLAEVK